MKLAECLAETSPKEAIQQLENIPRQQRSLRVVILLGKLYRRCNHKEAAIETFKVLCSKLPPCCAGCSADNSLCRTIALSQLIAMQACLKKCNFVVEAAVAMAELGVPAAEIDQLLCNPETKACSKSSIALCSLAESRPALVLMMSFCLSKPCPLQ